MMNVKNRFTVAFGAALVSVLAHALAGCATSDAGGARESDDVDVAVIRGASRGTVLVSPTPVIIRQVDGRKVSGASSSVRVSPGEHHLVVTCYESMFSRNTHELTVLVAAGRTYDLVSNIDPNKISDGTPDCEAQLTPSGQQ